MGDSFSIAKFVGTGNDFLFIDESLGLPLGLQEMPRSTMARRLCDRHFGAGADGLIFIKVLSQRVLRWDFYNNDGSPAEMCGNASRCVGRWAEMNLGVSKVDLETAAGLVSIDAGTDGVTSHLDYLNLDFKDLFAEFGGKTWRATLVNTGVPHAVIEVDELEKSRTTDFMKIIQAFRFHPGAGPRGANITCVRHVAGAAADGTRKFETVTFERGVEGFTLSCGTGVLAAAAVGLRTLGCKPESADCEVRAPGGILKAGFGAGWRGARLSGSSKFVYKADFSANAIKDDKP